MANEPLSLFIVLIVHCAIDHPPSLCLIPLTFATPNCPMNTNRSQSHPPLSSRLPQEIYLTIANEYTDWSRNSASSTLDSVIETISDATVVAPVIRTALLHQRSQRLRKNLLSTRTRLSAAGPSSAAKNSPPQQQQHPNEINSPISSTYFYCFAYLPDLPNQSAPNADQARIEPTHGSDLAYLFGHPLLSNGTVGSLGFFPNRKYNRDEQHLSRAIITYWTNFIRTG